MTARGRFEHPYALRHDFLADAVAGDHSNIVDALRHNLSPAVARQAG
jgi:hypothetical protein